MKNETEQNSDFKLSDEKELEDCLIKKENKRRMRVAKKQDKMAHLFDEKNNKKKIKNRYKIDKLKNKKSFKEEKEQIRNKHPLFRWRNFFTKWFYLGVGLLLLSIIIALISDILIDNQGMQSLKIVFEIICGLLSTIGIALLVGCIFDFSKNSEAFLEFVSEILTDIIVSKTFLSSLTANDKKSALKLILQPSFKQIEQYSNINEYFKKKIDDSMKMFDTNFKTNLILNIEAKKSPEGFIYCESLLTYVVYKLGDKFEPIKISYEKSGSKTKEVKLIHEDGEFLVYEEESQKEIQGGITQDSFSFDIPEELRHYDRLTVRRKMYEPGNDHWINYIWESLTPYEGIGCQLRCFDGLTVKDFMIYDNMAYYQTDISEDRTTLNITSSQWLEPATGFFITISDTDIKPINPNTRTTQEN